MLNEQIKNEQTQQEQKLDVNFSHRLSPWIDPGPGTVAYLVDTLEMMTARAIAMLFVLEDNLIRSDDMLDSEIIGNVISAVRLELSDIQKTARATLIAHNQLEQKFQAKKTG